MSWSCWYWFYTRFGQHKTAYSSAMPAQLSKSSKPLEPSSCSLMKVLWYDCQNQSYMLSYVSYIITEMVQLTCQQQDRYSHGRNQRTQYCPVIPTQTPLQSQSWPESHSYHQRWNDTESDSRNYHKAGIAFAWRRSTHFDMLTFRETRSDWINLLPHQGSI